MKRGQPQIYAQLCHIGVPIFHPALKLSARPERGPLITTGNCHYNPHLHLSPSLSLSLSSQCSTLFPQRLDILCIKVNHFERESAETVILEYQFREFLLLKFIRKSFQERHTLVSWLVIMFREKMYFLYIFRYFILYLWFFFFFHLEISRGAPSVPRTRHPSEGRDQSIDWARCEWNPALLFHHRYRQLWIEKRPTRGRKYFTRVGIKFDRGHRNEFSMELQENWIYRISLLLLD